MIGRPLALLAALASLVAGCGPSGASPAPALPAAARCDQGAWITGDLEADLDRLVRGCGLRQRRLTPPQLVREAGEGRVSRFSFPAGGPGRCYRVYAAASPGVSELRAVLRAPSGRALLASDGRAPFLVLPAAAPLCLPEAGDYGLEVAVTRGEGPFALEVWEDLDRPRGARPRRADGGP